MEIFLQLVVATDQISIQENLRQRPGVWHRFHQLFSCPFALADVALFICYALSLEQVLGHYAIRALVLAPDSGSHVISCCR